VWEDGWEDSGAVGARDLPDWKLLAPPPRLLFLKLPTLHPKFLHRSSGSRLGLAAWQTSAASSDSGREFYIFIPSGWIPNKVSAIQHVL